MIRHAISNLNAWLAILAVVLSSSAGDVLLSRAMKQIGDLGQLRARRGLAFVILLMLRNRYFLIGVGCLAVSFYSLLYGLSWNDVSLIGPAAASMMAATTRSTGITSIVPSGTPGNSFRSPRA